MAPVFAGTLAGAAIVFETAHYVQAMLYGVSPTNLASFAVSALALTCIALAVGIPAKRAARLDPIVALRHE